jgi:uncharacterized protein YecT (DUF1311 family)
MVFALTVATISAGVGSSASAGPLDELMRGLMNQMSQQGAQRQPPAGAPRRAPPQGGSDIADANAVRELQSRLDAMGYDAGVPDGEFGRRTYEALRAFQRDHGLQATGALDPATRAMLASPARPRPVPFATRAAQGPSFDCNRASTTTEETICRVPDLAVLDARIGGAYAAARAAAPSPAAAARLARQQRIWLQRRAACGADANCLRETLASRLQALGGGDSSLAPAAQGPRATDKDLDGFVAPPSRAGANVSAGTGDQAPAEYAAELLVHPTGDLRPQRLFLWNGLVVLNHPGSLDQQGFFRLLALGLRPTYLSSYSANHLEDRAAEFSSQFLASSNPLAAPSESWRGRDEFTRQDARRAFLARYTGILQGMAPKLPFDFALTLANDLPQYDAVHHGFELNFGRAPLAGTWPAGVHLRADFDWPKPFWPASEARAREILQTLEQGAGRGGNGRQVRIIATLEATDGNSETLTVGVRLKQLAIYDPTLTTRLYAFDVAALNHGTVASTDIIARLASPPPGVEPWTFAQLDGEPVLGANARAFFQLVTYAAKPSLLDDDDSAIRSLSYLTADARREFPNSGGRWQGADEFASKAIGKLFHARYAKVLSSLAPRAPFQFLIWDKVRLGAYNEARAAFPLRPWPLDVEGAMRSGGLQPIRNFAWPSPEWSVPLAEAPRVLRGLGGRTVAVVARIVVDGIDGTSLRTQIRLASLSLYTDDLRRKLYEFPVHNDAGPYLTAKIPATLAMHGVAALNETTLCAELLAAGGLSASNDAVERCWRRVAARDEAFYAARPPTDLAPNDARRPFFPRGGSEYTPLNKQAFLRWASAYAAGLAASGIEVTGTIYASRGRDTVVSVLSAGSAGTGQLTKLLAAEALQPDQLAGASLDGIPILFALPNRVALYSVQVPATAGAQSGPMRVTSLLAIRTVKTAAADDGRPMLLIYLVPQSTKILAEGGQVVATRSFRDIPFLNASSFVSSPTGGTAKGAPIALDSTGVDLMIASSVGDKLSPEALAHLVARRWIHENGTATPVGGRFFVLGKRSPTAQEAADIGPRFVAWARGHAPAFPVRVAVHEAVELQKGGGIGWDVVDCLNLAAYPDEIFSPLQQFGYAVLECTRAGNNGNTNPDDLPRCLASRAALMKMQSLHPIGRLCRTSDPLRFADPVKVTFRDAGALPQPQVTILGTSRRVDLSATLEITDVLWSKQPPRPFDELPAPMRKVLQVSASNTPPSGEYITIGLRPVDVRYSADGKPLPAPKPAASRDIDGLVNAFAKLSEENAAPTIPTAAYGPDLIGIRLGMTFEDAERAIRAEMQVGRTMTGIRAIDPAAKAGFNRPMTSGKLYVSADGRELIALIDEPPTAANRVVAVWRRLYVAAGTYTPEELFASIRKKYLDPAKALHEISSGSIHGWLQSRAPNCGNYLYIPNRWLMQSWAENGRPAMYQTPTGPAKDGMLPAALYDPLESSNNIYLHCGPVVAAEFLNSGYGGTIPAAGYGGVPMNQLDMSLSDFGRYAAIYAASREALRKARADAPAASAAAPPKF